MTTRGDNTTRDKLIEAARRLFYERGYEATGVAEILREAGARSGSLYYFFQSKEGLLLEVLDSYRELLYPLIVKPAFSRTEDSVERIFAILDVYRGVLVNSKFRLGCPIGNLSLELGDRLPEARRRIAQNFDGWCLWIEHCIEDSNLPPAVKAGGKDLARFILTVMEGAVMQARVHQSIEPFDAGVRQLRRHLKLLANSNLEEERE